MKDVLNNWSRSDVSQEEPMSTHKKMVMEVSNQTHTPYSVFDSTHARAGGEWIFYWIFLTRVSPNRNKYSTLIGRVLAAWTKVRKLHHEATKLEMSRSKRERRKDVKQNIEQMLGKNSLSGKLIVWLAHNANTQNHTPTQRRTCKVTTSRGCNHKISIEQKPHSWS